MEERPPILTLVDWANQQRDWVRRVVADVVRTGESLDDDHLQPLVSRCLTEEGIISGQAEPCPKLYVAVDEQQGDSPLCLVALQDVRNVNALLPGQSIAFSPQLTILYGENGAGKTGYVRIIKRIAGGRSAEVVLPDVTSTSRATPTATIAYRIGAEEGSVLWEDQVAVCPFTRMSVFDSRAVPIHVDQELTYFYTPQALLLFRFVTDSLEALRSRLQVFAQDASPKSNPYPGYFAKGTTVHAQVEALGADSDVKRLAQLATLSEEETSTLSQLRLEVIGLQGGADDARLRVLQEERDLYSRAQEALEALRGFQSDEYRRSVECLIRAEKAVSDAALVSLSSEQVPGALSEAWRAFIAAGEAYIGEIESGDYPSIGKRCVYCRQELGHAAVSLLRKYREYSNSELRDSVRAIRTNVDELGRSVTAIDVVKLWADIEKERERTGKTRPILEQLHTALSCAPAVRECILRRGAVTTLPEATTLEQAVQAVTEATSGLDVQIGALRADATSRQARLTRKSVELAELEARLGLGEHLPGVIEHVQQCQKAEKTKALADGFRRLLRTLTDAAKRASENLLNRDFEKRFRAECEALHAPPVQMEFPGKRGEAVRRKSVAAAHKPSDILSEGEQKAIALADFLAEVSLGPSADPIVLDDPVNSLDYKRISYVVARILGLAMERQLIVFTHNIWFTMELLAAVEESKVTCSYYTIGCPYFDSAEGRAFLGMVTPGAGPRTDGWSYLSGRVNETIQKAKSAQGEERADLIERGYSYLRSVCECVVERDLLQQAIERYQPHIRMTALEKIKADRLGAAFGAVVPVFTKACRYTEAHSQPLETLNTRPSLDELMVDWQAVQDARNAYRAS